MDIPNINEPWGWEPGAVRIAAPPRSVEMPDGTYIVTYTFEINDVRPDVVVEPKQ